jgi:hypothetical protein
MRKFLLHTVFIFGFAIALLSCSKSLAQHEISRIEYTSDTRGFHRQLILTPDSLTSVTEDFRASENPVIVRRAISRDEWTSLLSALGGIKPEEIQQLKSPGDKRAYDAAPQGSITITTKDSNSFSHGFDDPDPNEKLKPLIKQLLKLVKN